MKQETFEYEGKIYHYLTEELHKHLIRTIFAPTFLKTARLDKDKGSAYWHENEKLFRKYDNYGANYVLELLNQVDEIAFPSESCNQKPKIEKMEVNEKMDDEEATEALSKIASEDNELGEFLKRKGFKQETTAPKQEPTTNEKMENNEQIQALSTDFAEADRQIQATLHGVPEMSLFSKSDEEVEPLPEDPEELEKEVKRVLYRQNIENIRQQDLSKPQREDYVLNEDFEKDLQEWEKKQTQK